MRFGFAGARLGVVGAGGEGAAPRAAAPAMRVHFMCGVCEV